MILEINLYSYDKSIRSCEVDISVSFAGFVLLINT